ncbi:Ubiquitin domain-containing protein DSK2a [Dictyocoela muelleri]|nr:Ubiquitin domain-containing protein DSK2a [Dictyocoela muelleri]
MKVSIKVKNKTISLEIDDSLTILDLKKKTVLEMEDPKPEPENLYFIYGGKKLDDSAIINSLLKDGYTVHATVMKKQEINKKIEIGGKTVYGKSGDNAGQNNAGGSFYGSNPYGASTNQFNAGANPFNVGSNPFGAMGLNDINSQIEMMLNNPSLLDLTLDQMPGVRTPEQKEEMKKMMTTYLKSIKDNPELLQMAMNPEFLRSAGFSNPMVPPMQNPMVPPMQNPMVPPMQNPYMNPNMSNPNMGSPQMSPNMNNPMMYPPYMYPPPRGYYPYYNYYQPIPQPPPNINYEEAFKDQLSVLEEMGYKNKSLNIEALKKSNGDINRAVEYLIEWSK